MRHSFLAIFFCFFFNFSFAQDPVVQIDIRISEEINDSTTVGLGGSSIEIFMDSVLFYSANSNNDGRFELIDLPMNHVYLIYYKKSNYVTKVAEVNTHYKVSYDLPPIVGQIMMVSLFKQIDGIDFSFVETTPMIKFQFTEDYPGLVYSAEYLKSMLAKVEAIRNK